MDISPPQPRPMSPKWQVVLLYYKYVIFLQPFSTIFRYFCCFCLHFIILPCHMHIILHISTPFSAVTQEQRQNLQSYYDSINTMASSQKVKRNIIIIIISCKTEIHKKIECLLSRQNTPTFTSTFSFTFILTFTQQVEHIQQESQSYNSIRQEHQSYPTVISR